MTKDKDILAGSTVAAEGDRKHRVVIIGGGFAGIHAAKALANSAVDVTLIDRRNHHTFQPLLYQVALAVLPTSDIASPIRTILRMARNVEVVMDEVVTFDLKNRQVFLDSGIQLKYDYLIVATGATHSYFGHNEWEEHAPGLKTIDDALEIRRRVLLAYELAERDALGVETDRRGRVIVNPTLSPADHPEIFVCGDLAYFVQNGAELPGVAQPAMQMGTHAGRMILQDQQGLPRSEFRYFDKGDMATIGRYCAIARIKWPFHANWSGLPAWFTWLLVHLVFIIRFRNRISILFEWAWTYLFYMRGSRLITGNRKLEGWIGQQRVPDASSSLPPGAKATVDSALFADGR